MIDLAPSGSDTAAHHFRPARPSDASFFFDLRARVIGPHWRADVDDPEWIERHLHGPPSDFECAQTRIVTVSTERVGVVDLGSWKRGIVFRWLMLEPAFQGRGIGTQLVQLVQSEARAQGRYVLLDVLHSNVDARRLYERLGFVPFIDTPHVTQMYWGTSRAERAAPANRRREGRTG